MLPIMLRSLRDRRTTMLFWALGISAYIALNVLVYSTIKDQTANLNQALQNIPPTARSFFTDTNDFLSPVGYMNAKLYYLMLPLLFSMLAITLSGLLTREEENGTLELLLARPVSRTAVFLAKFFASLLILGLVGLIALGVTVLTADHAAVGIPVIRLAAATFVTILLALVFGSFAWMLAGLGGWGRRACVGGAVVLALGSYLVTSLEGSVHWLQTPAKYLPYHYVQASHILSGTYTWWNALLLVVLTIIFTTAGCVGFRRRDLS